MSAASATVVAPAAFATAPDMALEFEPDTLVLKVTAGTADISFDGVGVHLTLTSSDSILAIPVKRKKLWVKQNGGAATLRWSALTLA
jgi:hypothetical protein